jgi:hypothetical protein
MEIYEGDWNDLYMLLLECKKLHYTESMREKFKEAIKLMEEISIKSVLPDFNNEEDE